MPKKMKSATNEWDIGICEAPLQEPITCLIAMFCCPCYIYMQRMDIYEGKAEKEYLCCGGAYGDCACGGKSCPGICTCMEILTCPWCALYGNRYLIQSKYQIRNSWFDTCLIYTACICSWLGCLVQILAMTGLVNKQYAKIMRKAKYVLDCIYLAFAGCLLAQQQHEMEFQANRGPTSVEMTQM